MIEDLRPEPLREKVKSVLLDRILSGELRAGADINETGLAEELGVSRTPLREALHALNGERLITTRPGRGFLVAPLDAEEARNLYEAIGLLESSILRSAGPPEPEVLEEMRSLTDRRTEEHDEPRRNVEQDWAWHDRVLSACRNEVLLDGVHRVKTRILRYELRYMHDRKRIDVSIDSHRTIEDALDEGRLDDAADRLRDHWEEGIAVLDGLEES